MKRGFVNIRHDDNDDNNDVDENSTRWSDAADVVAEILLLSVGLHVHVRCVHRQTLSFDSQTDDVGAAKQLDVSDRMCIFFCGGCN